MSTARSPDSPTAPPRRCLACGYLLEFLSASRCPECGRVFDPGDPATYRRGEPSLVGDVLFALLIGVMNLLILPVAWLIFVWMFARSGWVRIGPAAFAGAASAFAHLFAAAVFTHRRLRWAFGCVLPAAALLIGLAVAAREPVSAVAVVLGLGLAALVRLARART